MNTLITRLREAKEGSRELDADVYEAVDPNFPKATTTRIEVAPGDFRFATGMYSYADAPFYTTDLSAAVALCERVLPGWWWRVGTCSVHSIELNFHLEFGPMVWFVDGRALDCSRMEQLAYEDGFSHPITMTEFWFEEHGTDQVELKFTGTLIRWRPITWL